MYYRFFKNRNWLFTEFPELAPHLAEKFPQKVDLNGIPKPASEENVSSQSESPACGSENANKSITQILATPIDAGEGNFPGKDATYRILEIGCGVGNTIFPLLETNDDAGLFVYGADFSATAIDIVQQHKDYDTKRLVFVCNFMT